LRKWDNYDLRVYVPEGMNSDGTIDLAAECRAAMEIWNTALGLTVFTETDDPANAKIEIQYLDLTNAYGRVSTPRGSSCMNSAIRFACTATAETPTTS